MSVLLKFYKSSVCYCNLINRTNDFILQGVFNIYPIKYNIIRNNIQTYVSLKQLENPNSSKDKLKTENAAKPEKKKKEKLTYITLVESNNNITVSTLEDATKLATRRNLKLIKIKDYCIKSDRATYQLMTTAQYLAEEKSSKYKKENKDSSVKGVKLLSLSSKINDHDINSKIKNMNKWLEKRYEVRIVISNVNDEAENIYHKIIEGTKEMGKLVQKRTKGSDLKFQLVPHKMSKVNSCKSVDTNDKVVD